jgi:large subunit ribosomal protein L18
MGKTSTFSAPFRRRRQGKTNYKKRLALLKGKKPRLVARKTNLYITAQVIEFDSKGDKTKVHVNSRQLDSFGWKAGKKNLAAAYLTGLLAGVKAKQAKIEEAVLDIGFARPVHRGWWSSVLKGALDAGLKIKADAKALPEEARASGKHVEDYTKKPVTAMFEKAKQEILKSKKDGDLDG